MDDSLNVIDPALRNFPGGNVPDADTTNGAARSRNTSRLPLTSPARSSTRTIPRYSKDDVESWAASNYAPRRDVNETRGEYEERLYVAQLLLASFRS
jgi:hypothetical protein